MDSLNTLGTCVPQIEVSCGEMDLHDATALLLGRIEKQDPEHVGKIMGFLLLQDHSDKDLIRLAHSPDKVIEEKVQEAQIRLASLSPNTEQHPHPHNHPLPFTQIPYVTTPPASYWNPLIRADQQHPSFGYQDSGAEDYNRLSNQIARVLGIDDHAGSGLQGGEFYYNDPHPISMTRINRQMPMSKTCHYFNKGFCKHGSNCRYLHGSLQDNLSNVFVSSSNEGISEDHVFSPMSLEKLDSEISEILKSRKGHPISIASLPMVYQEKYGRSLRAEGYLTESQRHGRAGYSLTKLLARLKSIRLFDRPHGQHFVILAEDAAKYSLENHSKDPGPVVAGSRQIYLTFPAESTFTEEDVSNYFRTFGSVEDVRIPCQQKRMFGFVTFSCPNTVKMVLAKGNPHFVCGARVLVKPYREKSKLVERKFIDKAEHNVYYQGRYWDFEHEFHPMPRCGAPRFLRRQIMEEQERALELETRRLMGLKIARKPASTPPYMNNTSMEELNASEERMNHLIDALNNNNGSSYNSDDQSRNNQAFNLPENPFAPQIPSSIPTAN